MHDLWLQWAAWACASSVWRIKGFGIIYWTKWHIIELGTCGFGLVGNCIMKPSSMGAFKGTSYPHYWYLFRPWVKKKVHAAFWIMMQNFYLQCKENCSVFCIGMMWGTAGVKQNTAWKMGAATGLCTALLKTWAQSVLYFYQLKYKKKKTRVTITITATVTFIGIHDNHV